MEQKKTQDHEHSRNPQEKYSGEDGTTENEESAGSDDPKKPPPEGPGGEEG